MTTRGVFKTEHSEQTDVVEELPFPDDIVDAIRVSMPENRDTGESYDRIIAIDNQGRLFQCIMEEEYEIAECYSRLINQLNDQSQWYGFMIIDTDDANNYQAVGIHNRDGYTYLINGGWMIKDIDIPREFHFGNMTTMKSAYNY